MYLHRRIRSKTHRRRGSLTVELILVLPILILVCLATIQFGILMTVHQAVTHAATVAAREAAKGASIAQLKCIVEEVLAPHCLSVGDCVSVVLEDGVGTPDAEQIGNVPCPLPSQALPTNSVRVSICVDTSCRPFINPLSSFGFSLANRILCERAVVPKE
ncbi:MAG: pilus assembly protein [Gemmataceae bacterium]|nr:pilus assembly protein [Gemmataceae bacterium]